MSLRSIFYDLMSTKEPSLLSLVTSFDVSVSSIASVQGKLTNISKYRARMFDYYRDGIDRKQVRDLNITKKDLMSLFIDPRTKLQPPMSKRHICMDWCNRQQFKDNWMNRRFMVFDKPPCNNREVPLYFLRKLREEFILGHHVNFLDIGEFQEVGLGSTHDREHARHDPMLGPHPPRWRLNPLLNILPM